MKNGRLAILLDFRHTEAHMSFVNNVERKWRYNPIKIMSVIGFFLPLIKVMAAITILILFVFIYKKISFYTVFPMTLFAMLYLKLKSY